MPGDTPATDGERVTPTPQNARERARRFIAWIQEKASAGGLAAHAENLLLRVILKLLASRFLVITLTAAVTAMLVVTAIGMVAFLLTESGVITITLEGAQPAHTMPENEAQPAPNGS